MKKMVEAVMAEKGSAEALFNFDLRAIGPAPQLSLAANGNLSTKYSLVTSGV